MSRRADIAVPAYPTSVAEARGAVIARMVATTRHARQAMAVYRNGLHLLEADQIYLFSTALGALDNMLRAFEDPKAGG